MDTRVIQTMRRRFQELLVERQTNDFVACPAGRRTPNLVGKETIASQRREKHGVFPWVFLILSIPGALQSKIGEGLGGPIQPGLQITACMNFLSRAIPVYNAT